MTAKQDRVLIFDTTLRDGEQSPGASLNTAEKIEIARALERLRVDVIEAGFPITSPDDFEAVTRISKEIEQATVCGLARAVEKDIVRAAEALESAKKPRIHTFIGTSPVHREYQIRKSKEQVLELAVDAVTLAKTFTDDVEFSPMDASRTEFDYLAEVLEAAIDAGAVTVNIPDTVGYATPEGFGDLIAALLEHVGNIDRAVISVHCHNDLGLGVANSLAAVKAGARQVECSINGLGERAGNAALEEVAMALKTRADYFGVGIGLDTARLVPVSKLVSTLTGITVQRNKAIVGRNAFAHESGIHQDGILKEKTTFEIMNPEDVGARASELVLGKHSGRHALRSRVEEMGFSLNQQQIDELFERFKVLADKKKEVYDEDLTAMIEEELVQAPELFQLVSFQISSGGAMVPTATVRIRDTARDEVDTDAATGDGPVDAIYNCISRITGIDCRLLDYGIRAVTVGRDAQGEVTIQVAAGDVQANGRAISTDILEASALAYVRALNRIAAQRGAGGSPGR
ncbi:MAG: 2-isopropylmalate synthase [Planctomycetota bacterium]